MCGRFSLQTPVPDLAELFDVEADSVGRRRPRFNVAPTDDVLILLPRERRRQFAGVRWGLIPNWTAAPGDLPLMINARAETLEVKRAFRDLIPERRCAILADGFFEWRQEHGVKQPYFVRRRDGAPMAMAGLWDTWRDGDDHVESCTIVTTTANDLLDPLHDRMPVILDDPGTQLWLEWTIGAKTLDPLVPCASETLEVVPVGTRVNSVAYDDPDCIRAVDDAVQTSADWTHRPRVRGAPEAQLGFF